MVEPESYCTKTKMEKQMTYAAQQHRNFFVPKLVESLKALTLWKRPSESPERERSQSSSSNARR
eukprot:5691767-Amphidinium_carterae.1